MHVLALIVALLGGAAFWFYRLKYLGEAGAEVVDKVGKARGKYRRVKRQKMTAESPVMAIDSPLIAATTLLYTLMQTHPTTPAQDVEVSEALTGKASQSEIDEAVIYAKWVQTQDVPRKTAIKALCHKLLDWFSDDELAEYEEMLDNLRDSQHFIINEAAVQDMNRHLHA